MTGMCIRPLLHGSVAAMIFCSTAVVHADTAVSPARLVVATHDIDLTSAPGIEQLRKRVDSTIRWACGPVVNWTPAEVKALGECRAEAQAAVEPMVRKAVANGNPKFASN